MKRYLCLLTAGLLLAALLAGCAGQPSGADPTAAETSPADTPAATAAATETPDENAWLNETGLPIVSEPVSYKLLAPRSATQGEWDTLWVFAEMEERTGISWDIETVDSAGWDEKKNLAFATSELPDFFITGLNSFDVINYGTQGILISLNDLMDQYAVNINAYMEERPNIRKSITASDGNIYSIPGMDTTPRELNVRRFYVNTTWMENLGIETPQTVDDFYNMLVAFKEQDANGNGDPNDEIPAGGMYGNYFAMDIPILAAFGFVDTRIDTIDGQVCYVPVQDNYRLYLEYMNRLFEEELLDPEYFTQAQDQFTAKGSQALYGAYCYYASWVMCSDEALYNQYWMIPPMTSEVNDTQMWPGKDFNTMGGYAIVNTCEKPEGLMRLIDYFWTLEGRMMVRVGPESGTWDGEGGYKWTQNDQGQDCFEFDVPEQYSSFNEFREQVILPMAIPFGDDGTMGFYFTGKDPRQLKLTTVVTENCAPYYRVNYPSTYFTKEENDTINLIDTDLSAYVEQMEAKFIIGEMELSDENWNTFVSTVESMGLQEMLDIRQAAYDRWAQ